MTHNSKHPPPASKWDRGVDRFAVLGLSVFLVFSASYVLWLLLSRDYAQGGDVWRQGDWLVHNLAEDLRRGLFGRQLIALADLLGRDPVSVVIGLQAALVLALYGLLARLVFAQGQPVLLVMVVMCPALFVVSWPADFEGALRKELLAFVALLLTLLGLWRARAPLTWLGAVLFGAAVYGNEANVLFAPLYLGLFWAFPAGRAASQWGGAVLALGLGLHALWYALTHVSASDLQGLCAPLMERGLSAQLCEGAIAWMGDSPSDARARILEEIGQRRSLLGLLGVYTAALAPLAAAILYLRPRGWVLILALLSGVPFLPLYWVGLDWGRWIGLHAFSVAVIVLAGLASGRVLVRRRPPVWLVAGCVCLALIWVPYHYAGSVWVWPRAVIWSLFGDIF